MRSAGAGLLGALLMVAPLVAIPVLAVIGVPQFAPALSPARWTESFTSPVQTEEELAADLGEPADQGGKKSSNPRKSADDLYAPLPDGDWADRNGNTAATASAESAHPAHRTGKGTTRPIRTASHAERPRIRSNTAPRGSLGEWEVDAGWDQLTGGPDQANDTAVTTDDAEFPGDSGLASAPLAATSRSARGSSTTAAPCLPVTPSRRCE